MIANGELSIAEAYKIYGVPKSTLYHWRTVYASKRMQSIPLSKRYKTEKRIAELKSEVNELRKKNECLLKIIYDLAGER